MAKKKGRSANVARKREKRNRDRKSKHKQLSTDRQRKLPYKKMTEERLHACLLKTHDLHEEPELEKIHFNVEAMCVELSKLFRDWDVKANPEAQSYSELLTIDEPEKPKFLESDEPPFTSKDTEIFERFRTESFLNLMTPRFLRTLFSALTACENRHRRTGNLERAEVVFVAQTLFEAIPPDELVDHPLIQAIGVRTIRMIAADSITITDSDPAVREILSEAIESEDSEFQQEEIHLEIITKESSLAGDETQQLDGLGQLVIPDTSTLDISQPIPSPDSLPAKALYKNFEGLAIKEILKEREGYSLEKETATQLDYYNEEQELYVTATESRLQLHAHSEAELSLAMKELEAHCQSALMYLAKTYEGGGETDGTE